MVPLRIYRGLEDNVGLGIVPRHSLLLADFPIRSPTLDDHRRPCRLPTNEA